MEEKQTSPLKTNKSQMQSNNPTSKSIPSSHPIKLREKVIGDYLYAGFVLRILAIIIDVFILGVLNLVTFFIIGLIIGLTNSILGKSDYIQFFNTLAFLIMISVFSIVNVFYSVFFIAIYGATPGKMALGLLVVKEDKSKVTLWTAILRETIGKFISGLILNLGYLWVIWDEKKQAWHDKIAGTIVIEKRFLNQ